MSDPKTVALSVKDNTSITQRTVLSTVKGQKVSIPHFCESKIVTLLVGSQKHPFYVHRQILRDKIPYFEQLPWAVNQAPPVLEQVDIDGFRIVLRWLFNEELSLTSQTGALTTSNMNSALKVADELGMEQLQAKLIDCLVESLGETGFCDFQTVLNLRKDGLQKTRIYVLALRDAVRAFMTGAIGKELLVSVLSSIEESDVFREMMVMIDSYNKRPWSRLGESHWREVCEIEKVEK